MSFSVFDNFFRFFPLTFLGFCIFLVDPTMVSVLLSASVERFDVSRMRDFLGACHHFFVPATEVPRIVELVFKMELLAISCMSEVRSEHKVCLGLP